MRIGITFFLLYKTISVLHLRASLLTDNVIHVCVSAANFLNCIMRTKDVPYLSISERCVVLDLVIPHHVYFQGFPHAL